VLKHFFNQMLMSSHCIFQAKRHCLVAKSFSFSNEISLLLLFYINRDLMIPWIMSKKPKNLKSTIESSNLSIFMREKLSFRHALFKSVKYASILYFPILFFTVTTLVNQSRYMISWMNPVAKSLSTFIIITSYLSPLKFLFLC